MCLKIKKGYVYFNFNKKKKINNNKYNFLNIKI